MKKTIWVIVGIIILAGVFYGGMSYGKGQVSTSSANTVGVSAGQFGRGSRTGGAGAGGGFVTGQVISKDANSVTIKLDANPATAGQGGAAASTPTGSKIVFVDTSTMVTKTTNGTLKDLTAGTQISVTGTTNTDGSVTAKSVQIRPQMKQNSAPQQ